MTAQEAHNRLQAEVAALQTVSRLCTATLFRFLALAATIAQPPVDDGFLTIMLCGVLQTCDKLRTENQQLEDDLSAVREQVRAAERDGSAMVQLQRTIAQLQEQGQADRAACQRAQQEVDALSQVRSCVREGLSLLSSYTNVSRRAALAEQARCHALFERQLCRVCLQSLAEVRAAAAEREATLQAQLATEVEDFRAAQAEALDEVGVRLVVKSTSVLTTSWLCENARAFHISYQNRDDSCAHVPLTCRSSR